MTDPSDAPRRRRRQPPPPPPPAQGSVIKGAILVVVAVVIGVALLRDDSSTAAQVSVGADSPVTQPGDDSSTTSSTSSTTVALRPTSEVKVLVANGSDVNGAAGVQTNALKALGYVTGDPANAARVPATVIYFTSGYEGEAAALAEALGAPATAVQPLPTPAPVDDLQLSNILVVVGPDLARAG